MKLVNVSRIAGKLLSALLITAATGFTGLAQSTFTVSNTNDAGAGSLRQAIIDAEAHAGLDFIDATGITDTIKLVTALPTITQDLVITGPGKNLLAISGENLIRPFFITGGTVEITDLSIVKGWAKGNDGANRKGGGAGMGGAIYIDAGTLTVAHVAFSNNKASGGNTGSTVSDGSGDGPFPGSAGSYGSNGSYYYAATNGTNGGFGAGGGGGGNDPFQLSTPGSGGYGGYGGGGGGSGTGSYNSYAPFYRATSAAFGGYGSITKFSSFGGAGAGLGGALFIRSTATAFLNDIEFINNTAVGGTTDNADASNGQGKAGALFIHPGAEVYSYGLTFSGNLAANDGAVSGDDEDIYGTTSSYTPGAPRTFFAAATGIKFDHAVLNGSVDANTFATSYKFQVSTSTTFDADHFPVWITDEKSVGSADIPVTVSDTISGLQANTTYYFQLIAWNEKGTDSATVGSFKTEVTPVPVVTTSPATPELTTATLKALVNPKEFLTSFWFQWGTVSDLSSFTGTDTASAGSGSVAATVSLEITGLTEETTYYYRVVAENDFGQTVGSIVSFKTNKFGLPEVSVSGISDLTESTVTLNGIVNTKSQTTTYKFQYSTNPGFAPEMSTSEVILNGNAGSGAGNALQMNGSGQYVSIPDNGSLDLSSTFTIEAWVYYGGGNSTIYDKGDYRQTFQIQSGPLALYSSTGIGGWKYSTSNIPTNTWTHVAVTFNSNTNSGTFYINGASAGSFSGIYAVTPDDGEVNIGVQSPSSCDCNTFNGKLDEVRVWNTARSASEIADNYKVSLEGTESGLKAYWQFNETSGSTLADKTSNGNNGTLQGGPSLVESGATVSGTTAKVTANLTGLSRASAYYYRLTATNASGSQTSSVKTFQYKAHVPGIIFWVIADSGVTADEYLHVHNWRDLSVNQGSAVNVPGKGYPSLITNALNGHSTILFDGTSTVLKTNELKMGQNLSIVVVAKTNSVTGGSYGWQRILSDDLYLLFGYNYASVRNYFGNGAWQGGDALGSSESGNFQIRTTIHNGTSDRSYINGVAAAVQNFTRSSHTAWLSIGAGWENSAWVQHFDGEIAEIIIFDKQLSTDERLAIEGRLVQKYKIGVKDVVSDPSIPQGETGNYVLGNTGATVNFTDGTDTPGTIDAMVSSNPNINGNLPIGIQNLATEKYWSIVTSGLSGFTYSITLDLTGITGITDFKSIKVVKREDEFAPWIEVTEDPFFATVTYDDPYITISGLNSFSEFAVGSGSENTLPVELSAFTGQISGGKVVLNWSTTTETNNYGWEIERSEDRSQKTEGRINTDWETIGFVAGKGTTTEAQSYSYSSPATGGSLKFRLKQIDVDGKTTFSQIVSIEGKPTVLALNQNYPNPFNPSTTIGFALPASGKVNMVVFDILGREVATLLNKEMESGFHSVVFEASSYAAGVYFYKLSFNGKVVTKKLTLLK